MTRVDKHDQLPVVRKVMKQLVWFNCVNCVFLKLLMIIVHNNPITEETVKPPGNQAGCVLHFKHELVSQLTGEGRF